MVGTQIGNYRIEEKLGEGGMGVVYKGVDINLDRVVAIKALNTELRGNAELEQRFRAEAKAQANLNHTNLAILYALLIEDGRPWMVMEYIEGETLEQMIQRRGLIPSEEAIPLFRQALLGIGFAHRSGIVHRDIKPSNIMVNRQGIVKVMDFGIAKVLGGRGMTRTGTQMGTAFYMSPEQVLNRGVDIRSDIYSLGVTLYEMLTANVPFSGDSDYQIMSDHVNTPPPLPTKFYPYIPAGVQNAVLKAIEKKQDARFQTVEEFGLALEHPHDFGVVAGVPMAAPAAVPQQALPARPGSTVLETAPRLTGPGVAPIVPVVAAAMDPPAVAQPTQGVQAKSNAKLIRNVGIAAVAAAVVGVAWFTLKPQPKQDTTLPPLPAVASGGSPSSSQGLDTTAIPLNSQTTIKAQPQTSGQSSGGQSQTQQAQTGQTQAARTQSSQTVPPASTQSAPPPPPPATGGGLMIPAGTMVTIRMINPVNSARNRPGQRFNASVDAPVVLGGRVVIPRGAPAQVLLDNVEQAGHIEGHAAIGLELVSLVFGGYNYSVHSYLFEQQGASRGKDSAGVIGGAAAAGAVIGGILGHGKGAAAGAAAGAGAGVGAQYATKGPVLLIPPETRINFVLRKPIKVIQ
jgi:eukaryotic-like serine/threonine-protein kinase